jgi:hypothetical protein
VRFRGLTAIVAACLGLGALAPSALASGSPQGPPAGPTTPPFYQCPAIGFDTSCQFLVDVTNAGIDIVQDPAQSYYDGADDVTVAVQNDTSAPLSSVHLGVAGSGDGAFGFDGDGLCNPGSGPSPEGCPFGPPGNNSTPFDYFGPDTVLEADPASADDGTVAFTTPLQPGQYTYFSLEAEPGGDPTLAGGNVNDVITSTLTYTGNPELGSGKLSVPTPIGVTDQAAILGPNATQASGSVTYKVYSNAACTTKVGESVKTIVTPGTIPPSDPIGAALPTNATYYWVVEYSGNAAPNENTPAKSACGNEVMTFGTPPPLPTPTVTTALSGGGQVGTQLTVPQGTAVTDNATIAAPGGVPVTGYLSYEVYTSSTCLPFTQVKGAGGGPTTGSGPASNALALGPGTYYFQAIYSGNSALSKAASPCGSEILTVAAPPPPPPPPSSQFTPVGNPQVNTHNGQLVVIGQFPAPGTATSTAIVQQGASIARVRTLAIDARHRHCPHGYVHRGSRCINNAPATYGTTILAIPAPGTYSIVINPSSRVLRALKQGKRLDVTISTTFQNKAGGAPVTHLQTVRVKLRIRHHHHRH